MKDKRLKPLHLEGLASLPPELAELDESWDEDRISLELDETDDAFDRPTAVPSIPTETLARQMMRSLEGSRPENEASGPKASSSPQRTRRSDELPPVLTVRPEANATQTAAPPAAGSTLELDQERAPATALELADNNATPELKLPSTAELPLDLGSLPSADPPSDPALQDMKDRYAIGDFTGSLVIAESILEGSPGDKDAQRYATSCRGVLTEMYAARLGSLNQRVTVAIPIDQIRWLSLDHRAGFLLSLVDGSLTIEELLDVSGMSRLDALRVVYTLFDQRVISLHDRA